MTNNPTPKQMAFGETQWHSSEEDGGPDVGILIGLHDGAQLWIGELSRRRWGDAGGDAMGLGSDMGSWFVLYPASGEPIVLGRMNAELMHSEVCDLLMPALKGSSDGR